MFRAFFQRLPLLASLVVLFVVSLSLVTPTAQANGQVCSLNCEHLYVIATVNAPTGTEGAYGDFDQYHPTLGATDQESLAQIDMDDGTHIVEVGWVSRPGKASSEIFVETRDLGNNSSCFVQLIQGTTNGWTCDFISFSAFNTTGYKPGSPVPSNGTSALIYLLNTGTDIYIQYGADWLGRIPNTHWSGGSFSSVKEAQWFGEVAVTNRKATHTQMGNGICGSNTGSAHISSMTWFIGQSGSGSFYPVNAPSSALTATFSSDYNPGHFDGNSFAYGGPGAHHPPCQ
jgi:hypothetical protein